MGPEKHVIPVDDEWALWPTACLRSAGMPFSWLAGLARRNGAEPADVSKAIADVVTRPIFYEAVVWHNPSIVRSWLRSYVTELRSGRGALGRRSYRETALARYIQRFCAKNDTIGFYGPVAWARLDDDEVDSLAVEGTGAIIRRRICLDAWAIDEVGRRWSRDPRIRPHLAPTRNPSIYLDDDNTLYRPPRQPARLSSVSASMLRGADGATPLNTLLRIVGERHEGHSHDELVAEFDRLEGEDLLRVRPRIPPDDTPERALRWAVSNIADPDLRAELERQLRMLSFARDRLGRTAGDPDATLDAFDQLAELYKVVCGREDVRSKGDAITGRTLVYQDCRRDLDVSVGRPLMDSLRAPLGLLLRSAQWLCGEVANAVADRLVDYHDRRRPRCPDGEVPLLDLLFAAGEDLAGGPRSPVHDVVEDFQLRWNELLSGDAEHEVRLRSTEIRGRVERLFPLRPIRWPAARQHSPDVMVSYPPNGRPTWVVGEIHLALNTLENRVFFGQSDNPAALLDATARDFPYGRFVPVFPRSWPDVTPRTYPPLAMTVPDSYRYWSFTDDDGLSDFCPIPGASLVVLNCGGELVVRPRSCEWEAPVLEVLGEFLSILVVNQFRMRSHAPHLPRVLIDDVVVCRESWQLLPEQFGGLPLEGAPGVRALDRLLADAGAPDRFFLRTSLDSKPSLVDRAVQPLMRGALRAVRGALAEQGQRCWVEVVEMLPGPDELWLADPDGRRYTSELRMVAVDRREASSDHGGWRGTEGL